MWRSAAIEGALPLVFRRSGAGHGSNTRHLRPQPDPISIVLVVIRFFMAVRRHHLPIKSVRAVSPPCTNARADPVSSCGESEQVGAHNGPAANLTT